MEDTDRPVYVVRETSKPTHRVIPVETWDAMVAALRATNAFVDWWLTHSRYEMEHAMRGGDEIISGAKKARNLTEAALELASKVKP